MLNRYLKMKRSGHIIPKLLLLQIILLVITEFAYGIDFDSLMKSPEKKLTPAESAEIIKKEHDKVLRERKDVIEKGFNELDSIGYTKEIFQYIIGDSAGEDLYKKVKNIRATYKHNTSGNFNENCRRLDEADIVLMTANNCAICYLQIKNRLLPNEVPKVTGEQLRAYLKEGINDSAVSLYRLFRYHLGIDSSCKAYGPIVGKLKKDKILSFILKYSTNERFYYYLESLSIDSLIMVFNEVQSFSRSELEILEKWDEEYTLEKLYNNLFKYYQQIKNINIEDAKKDEKLKSEYQKLLSLFNSKSTLKMLDYWDVRFKDTMDGTMYPEVREYIKNLHKE